jgi:hypothetical protein
MAFGGSSGSHFNLYANVYETSVNTGANQSTVRIDLYISCNSTSTGVYSLTGGSTWNANVNGNAASGSFNYDFRGNANTLHLATYDTVCGHDSSGNLSIGWSASSNMDDSPYVTTQSISGSFTGTHINRYANITFFNQQATDEGISFEWGSDNNVDYISWWSGAYDGGGHHDTPAGGEGTFEIDLHNLRSQTTYDITVAIRRADSGLWTNSGTAYPTTLQQDNFIGLRVP